MFADTRRSNETRTDVAARARGRGLARGAAVAALGVLAAGQLANMAYGDMETSVPEPWIEESHDLSDLSVRLEDGTVTGFGDEGATLLLVFDPECSHSESVVPSWTAWLSENRPAGIQVLGVTAGNLVAAARYARSKRWFVDWGTLHPAGEGSLGQAVTKRTPWVFAVDHDGRVIAHGHGSRLLEVARMLEEKIAARTQ